MLSHLSLNGAPTNRYYRARPIVSSVNPPTSHYESSPASTSSRRKVSTFTPRKRLDEHNCSFIGREWTDDSCNQTWTARERIKAVACVDLSRDGRWLAVGEAGYNPRVLLFSTAEDASKEVPISIVTDHTYGVRCVAFSPDMNYLATLGDYKDGFLFLWSFNSRTGQLLLHSANKCTANICDMTWCGRRSNLVTVGTRCIRVWGSDETLKQQSPVRNHRYTPSETQPPGLGPTPLTGRNVLLGCMVDCTFTCIVSIDDSTVVVGSETGHVCVVDVAESVLELKVLKKLNLAISSIAFVPTQRRLLVGTSRGLQYEDFDVLCKETKSPLKSSRSKAPRLSIRRSLGLLDETEKNVIATGLLRDRTITLDNNGSLQIKSTDRSELGELSATFAAHKSVILGVQPLPLAADRGNFFTYSKNGEVRFWNDGTLLAQESLVLDATGSDDEGCDNELTRMRYFSAVDSFIAADRFGVLKLVRNQDWQIGDTVRAHSAETTCIAILNSKSLVATSSRDRTVQVFRVNEGTFGLLQTLDGHVGSVSQVFFAQEGRKLLSCSTDRSLIICERVIREEGGSKLEAYLTSKVLSLKSSPLSMTMVTENVLVVSTMDRCVSKVDISSGTLLESLKTGDTETNDTVSLNSLLCTPSPDSRNEQRLLVGYCSMDKSIRIYSEKSASLLVRESGHTEGVSDIALLEHSAHAFPGFGPVLVSTGLDGTIMIWNVSKVTALSPTPGHTMDHTIGFFGDEAETAKQSPASLPPVRKVLSKVEIADLTNVIGQFSPSSPRSLSPVRLNRKTSRLTLATSVEDVAQIPKSCIQTHQRSAKSLKSATLYPRRSPSPPVRRTLRGQRSRPELGKAVEPRVTPERSPSPASIPTPSPPKGRQEANKSRLRRAPSVPADLNSQVAAKGRRQSMSQASEFGSLAMATEQAARLLRIYKKKLINSKETVELDDIEYQVSGLLKTIRERKDRMANRRGHVKVATEINVDQLAVLLEGSKIAESPITAAALEDTTSSSA